MTEISLKTLLISHNLVADNMHTHLLTWWEYYFKLRHHVQSGLFFFSAFNSELIDFQFNTQASILQTTLEKQFVSEEGKERFSLQNANLVNS